MSNDKKAGVMSGKLQRGAVVAALFSFALFLGNQFVSVSLSSLLTNGSLPDGVSRLFGYTGASQPAGSGTATKVPDPGSPQPAEVVWIKMDTTMWDAPTTIHRPGEGTRINGNQEAVVLSRDPASKFIRVAVEGHSGYVLTADTVVLTK